MDNNEVKLPDFLNDLIKKEKREGLSKFEGSDFENKIYNRIRDQKRGRQFSFKWILAPASLIILFMFSLLVFRRDGKLPSGNNNFQLVLEKVMKESESSVKISKRSLMERTQFENLQNELLASGIYSENGLSDLSEHIKFSIFSATGGSETKLMISDEIENKDSLLIKKGITDMNKKDDYSELFSRIIIKLAEG